MSDGTLHWAEHQGIGCLKLGGELRHTLAEPLEQAAGRLEGQGIRELVLDLSAATFMDSTVIGLLVLLARRQRNAGHAAPVLVLEHPDLLQMLRQLHLQSLFRIQPAPPLHPQYHATGHSGDGDDRQRHARLILAAHQALVAADPRNAETFADVVQLFEAELRKTGDAA